MAKVPRAMLYDLLQRLAEGIVAVAGFHVEVVVYDFRDLEHSAVAVAGHVTGRKPGAPVPDLGFVRDALIANTPDQLNYVTKGGGRTLRSSTIWIRDTNGTPIGAVGINVDYTTLLQARDLLDQLAVPTRAAAEFVVGETFARDLDELVELSVADFGRQEGITDIESMSRADKLRLIQMLEERGLFRVRGAVSRVARLLRVSRATIYNFRSAVQDEKLPANQSMGG
jgi:predicted transcriptional regulator YheO